MSEDFQWEDDFQLEELTSRFDAMLHGEGDAYFDAEEYEVLIDYYQSTLSDEKARIALEYAVRTHPYSNRLKIRIARQMATEGKFMKAIKLLDEIEISEPADFEIIMTRGSVYSMMMDFQKAVNEFEKALVIVDEDEAEDVYSSIAFEYENMGAFDTALEYLIKALNVSAFPEHILFEIGMCYEMAAKSEESITFFTEYIDSNPYSVAAWFNLGLTNHHIEQYEQAVDAFEFAISIDEYYLPAYLSMAQSYSSMEKYEKAIEVYNESFELEAPEAITLYYVGECYEKAGNYSDALDYYNRAIELDENLPEPWAGIAVIFDEEGNSRAALNYIDKAIELDQLNTEFLLIQADINIKLQRYDKAKLSFQRIEEIDPNDLDLWKEYAAMYVMAGEIEKAIQILKTGLIHLPDHTDLMYRLVATLVLNNNLSQAVYYLENALQLNYEGHKELTDYFPGIVRYPKIVEIIESYKIR